MARKNVIVIIAAVTAAFFFCTAVYAGKQKGKTKLPEVVTAAIKAICPAGEIKEAKKEKEGLELYNVKLDVNGIEVKVEADAEGTIAEVETKEKIENLPAAVAETVAAHGGEVIRAEKEVIYAEIKLVKLTAPVTEYDVKIKKGDKVIEIQIAGDGKILREKTKKAGEGCGKDKD
jgi:biopolymer transport protein ExbD